MRTGCEGHHSRADATWTNRYDRLSLDANVSSSIAFGPATNEAVPGFYACAALAVPTYYWAFWVPALTFETTLLSFALYAGFQTIAPTKQWNMHTLVTVVIRDHIIYFIV